MMHRSSAPAAEFPNDNPDLHGGAIWVCLEPCSVAFAECRPELASEKEPAMEKNEDVLHDAIPTALASEELEESEDRPSMILPIGTRVADDEPEPTSLEDLVRHCGVDLEDDILIDELGDFDAPEVPAADPFSSYVATLAEVLRTAGDVRAASAVPALLCDGLLLPDALPEAAIEALVAGAFLERNADGLAATGALRDVANAWRRILRGESDDISTCGPATLDEWSADLLARLVAAPGKAGQLRKELRSRGVAAFGLIEAA